MGKKNNIKWVIAAGFFLILAGVGTIVLMYPEPPHQAIESTRLALSDAREKGADRYHKKEYEKARRLYDEAMSEWKLENERWFLLRDFGKVGRLADSAACMAKEIGDNSQQEHRNVKRKLETGFGELKGKAKTFDSNFAALPLPARIKDKQAKGKLLLHETEIAMGKGDYKTGDIKFAAAAKNVDEALQYARNHVDKYFLQLPEWQKDLKEIVEYSRKNRTSVVVVEKFPPRCEVYDNGKKIYTFKAEFGKNWMGDKQCEGDYATPEGNYRITKVLKGGTSKYYKALLLDYPNEADRVRFRQLKKEGKLPASARIGNLIEIHGGGGRGGNWTNGCVALENGEMDQLFRYAGKGTRVLVIGASEEIGADK